MESKDRVHESFHRFCEEEVIVLLMKLSKCSIDIVEIERWADFDFR